jgi:hypothetical protein
MSDYTEESVLFTPDGVIKGLSGIRLFYQWLSHQLSPGAFSGVDARSPGRGRGGGLHRLESRAVHPPGDGHFPDPGRKDSGSELRRIPGRAGRCVRPPDRQHPVQPIPDCRSRNRPAIRFKEPPDHTASEEWLRARPNVITLPEPGSWEGVPRVPGRGRLGRHPDR